VALRVADKLAAAYRNGVCFVDLASITESRLVAEGLASALGLAPASTDPLVGILTFLRDKALLLVLDGCEHVVEVAAQLAESVLKGAPNVHLLVSSREALRAESESVHHLAPLRTPPADSRLALCETLAFPAVQLFVERAAASLDTFELDEADAPVVAEICRGLGGNPLAIEVAAARVDLGLRGLAASLKDGMQLAIKGRRTAVARHRTLRATLDWSHDLLPLPERILLRRLAAFVGDFDLGSATHVVAEGELDAAAVFGGIISLVAKSLICVELTGEKTVYRLPDTTRAYALEKLRDAGELTQVRGRLAQVRCTARAAEIPAQAALDASNPPLARRSGMSGQLLNELAAASPGQPRRSENAAHPRRIRHAFGSHTLAVGK
jgi:predicted ATPase